eukprot:m.95742 g.95742  ORF g.95742 m.95742 type:complete len:82 (-) comp26845_c0_seq2:1167-1412(-)
MVKGKGTYLKAGTIPKGQLAQRAGKAKNALKNKGKFATKKAANRKRRLAVKAAQKTKSGVGSVEEETTTTPVVEKDAAMAE